MSEFIVVVLCPDPTVYFLRDWKTWKDYLRNSTLSGLPGHCEVWEHSGGKGGSVRLESMNHAKSALDHFTLREFENLGCSVTLHMGQRGPLPQGYFENSAHARHSVMGDLARSFRSMENVADAVGRVRVAQTIRDQAYVAGFAASNGPSLLEAHEAEFCRIHVAHKAEFAKMQVRQAHVTESQRTELYQAHEAEFCEMKLRQEAIFRKMYFHRAREAEFCEMQLWHKEEFRRMLIRQVHNVESLKTQLLQTYQAELHQMQLVHRGDFHKMQLRQAKQHQMQLAHEVSFNNIQAHQVQSQIAQVPQQDFHQQTQTQFDRSPLIVTSSLLQISYNPA